LQKSGTSFAVNVNDTLKPPNAANTVQAEKVDLDTVPIIDPGSEHVKYRANEFSSCKYCANERLLKLENAANTDEMLQLKVP